MSDARPHVRLATRADVATLSELRLALFREIRSGEAWDERAFLAACRAAYEELFDAGRDAAWVAEASDGTIGGTLTLLAYQRLPSPPAFGNAEGYVVGTYTDPAWRQRGVATALMRAGLDEARRRGLVRIRLHSTEQGRRVYAAQGFRPRADEMEIVL